MLDKILGEALEIIRSNNCTTIYVQCIGDYIVDDTVKYKFSEVKSIQGGHAWMANVRSRADDEYTVLRNLITG